MQQQMLYSLVGITYIGCSSNNKLLMAVTFILRV